MDSTWQRSGARGFVFRDNLNGFKTANMARGSSLDGFARAEWVLKVFGLDVMNRNADVAGEANWRRFARVRFASHLQAAIDAGVVVDLDPARMKEYTLARVAGRTSGAGVAQAGLLSRELQWIGIVAQHGEFQRRHRLLCQGSAAGPLDRFFFPSAGGTLVLLKSISSQPVQLELSRHYPTYRKNQRFEP